MADKCHLCLLGLIILSSLLTGTSGVDDDHVFISSFENVRLPCNNDLHDCKSTTWNYNNSHSSAVELIVLGKKRKDTERHERLSLGSDCSLNIKNVIKEDSGSYTCQQWTGVNGLHQKQATDAHVYLHVLHGNFTIMWSEISAGSSVTLYCQLYSYTGVSCDDWIHSEAIQLFWVNQAGVKLTISDSRYQESASGYCIITLNKTLLNEDDNREWRCEVTHRNQVKITYTVKKPAQDKTTTAVIPVHITKSTTTTAVTSTRVVTSTTALNPNTAPISLNQVFVIVIVVGALFAVLLPALILWLIRKKRV
ncbi:uncharacterized protein LOC127158152, partial [Labeo rohita]|uniref:uncharacterized protein LOC127158152 n=1 Tax=Labeo rohita TaxID=84645 RepID=UPI0021E346CB